MSDSAMVQVDGLRLRVSVVGDRGDAARLPLLLCNGLGASLELWEPFRAQLNGLPTVAFDAPGVGKSDVPSYPPTFRTIARTVAGMLDALEITQVDVLGVSWGGALAQELAHRHPSKVRRLVLAATVAGWTSVPGDPRALAILATPFRYWSRGYFERIAPTLYGGEIRANPKLLRQQGVHRFIRPTNPRGYAWQLLAGRGWTSLPWLHRLPQPTLVLAGDDDPLVPLVNARLLATRIPGATLHVVSGGGHLFLVSRAAQVAPVVTDFLTAA